ncbi:MAG: hypothetical protein JWM27_4310 [Gemmatimonadetes bacterium]|nr:hypothetical protein [Gemmatimonadota bacterium]
MLIPQSPVRLSLFLGDTVPLPAPAAVMSALSQVTVTMDASGADGFQLTLRASRDTVMDYSLVMSGALSPFKRVVIGVYFGAVPEILIDGVITHQQLTPSADPGASTLTVMGKDVSQMMDLEEKSGAFANHPDSAIAAEIIGAYGQYGLAPAATTTTDVPIETQRTPRQYETDLACVRRLAQRNGFVFYVEPQALGSNVAYWGPENRLSAPQPALTVGLGSQNNVKGLHFSHDGLAAVATKVTIVEPMSGQPISVPPPPVPRVPPLAATPTVARRLRVARDAAQDNAGQAATAALSSAMNAADPVTAQGELDAARYGHALRARKLVGVRGAGFTFDGLYFVRNVTHTIVPGTSYTQSFSLSREGTGSTLPAVPA